MTFLYLVDASYFKVRNLFEVYHQSFLVKSLESVMMDIARLWAQE